MSKAVPHEILDDTELTSELLQFEKSFREVTRIEFLEYDMETLQSKAERGHSQESSGFSIMDTVASIVRDEAVKILWSKYGKSTCAYIIYKWGVSHGACNKPAFGKQTNHGKLFWPHPVSGFACYLHGGPFSEEERM